MPHLPPPLKSALGRAINAARAEGRPVERFITQLAKEHGVDRATLYRWAKGEDLGAHARAALARPELLVVARYQGNRRAAWRHLRTEGYELSYQQFCKRLQATDTDYQAAVTEGMKAMIAAGHYSMFAGDYARAEIFGFDHTEIPVFTYVPGDKKPAKAVWYSHVVDWATGLILSHVFTQGDETKGNPNTATIVALVGSALIGREIGGVLVGGIPGAFVFDGAREHIANACKSGYVALGLNTHVARPGSPWENGSTESGMKVVESRVWSTLPGYSHHLPTRYAKFPWSNDELLTPEELIAETVAGIELINCEDKHSRYNKTRIEAWVADPSMVTFADPDLVRNHFLATDRATYKIVTKGVYYGGYYSHPAFNGNVGRTVTVRYLPGDDSFIDVYLDGKFLCSAQRADRQTKEAKQAKGPPRD